MWLEAKLNNAEHVTKVIPKAEKVLTTLDNDMRDMGGIRASKTILA